MPRDVVRLIGKALLKTEKEECWEKLKQWREVESSTLFPFYSLSGGSSCGYEHADFTAGPVIEYDKAREGKWNEAFVIGNTD
jgi:hypothetical protein